MRHEITQDDLRILHSPSRNNKIRIELLNTHGQTLSELTGEVISGSLRIDAQSDIRRTLNLELAIIDSSYLVGADKKIWMDKIIKAYYQIYDLQNHEWREYPLGCFVFTTRGYQIDLQSKRLSITALDLMAFTLESRGSQIGASSVVVEVDSNIRNAMIHTLERFTPLKDYSIVDFPADQDVVPYDLEKSSGIYPHALLAELRDLYPNYEMFIDVFGTFVCQKIPDSLSDPIYLTHEVLDPLIIREAPNNDFRIFNVTEVWGESLEADRTATECTFESNTYTLTIEGYEEYEQKKTFGFTAPSDCAAAPRLQIGDLDAIPIMMRVSRASGGFVDEPLSAGVIKEGLPYVVYYIDGVFLFQGELEVHAIVKEVSTYPSEEDIEADKAFNDCRTIGYVVNPDSPFSIEKIGEYRQVMQGGEYDAIYTSQLAKERASWENWKTTRLNDKQTLDMILIPFMDVNTKIEYTSPLSGEVGTYIVKQINMDLAATTMSVEAITFYPYYTWL